MFEKKDITAAKMAVNAIQDAKLAVENLGATPILTEAVALLGMAQNKVADHLKLIGDVAEDMAELYAERAAKDDI